ncbi:MAG: 1-(5-phosphoribosyl)-5-[(5-phosphoribosylamino)methylideneamino]imidazole-4-carboxamide isomerase [Clostridiales bacterium]|nr:1-(5-phosphoribosyl)-5-[(5-phosphoribosylamino)methylideneamino]imidazole-4-carboxamide isomerase [Clostridiales bacterium]
MIIFPAIDIKDKKCVRLTQGDYTEQTIYSDDPIEVALKWESEGATFLHLVDLDGARDGFIKNSDVIAEIIKAVNIPVQLGGGIRETETAIELLELGVDRVIIGTAAVKNIKWLREMLKRYGSKIVVSIDAKDGLIAMDGWETISEIESIGFIKKLKEYGVKTIVYTDIAKDGMLGGPNFQMYEELMKEVDIDIIASGGITSVSDLKRLKDMGVYGAIIGKALYDGKITVEEAMSC